MSTDRPAAPPASDAVTPGADDAPIEISAADFLPPTPEISAPPATPAEADLTAPAADTATRSLVPRAPRHGLVQSASPPAPDTGDGKGQTLTVAWRRDKSTLRARSSDGAPDYQVSHERTGSTSSSPESLRREAIVGVGDSSRTQQATATKEELPTPTLKPTVAQLDEEKSRSTPARVLAPAVAASAVAGEGPLDTNQGRRAFDVDKEGVARDNQAVRAASNETRPGLMDLSKAAAPGARDAISGAGPSRSPGVVSQPSAGSAAAVLGAPGKVSPGDQLALNLAAREYNRHELEIRQKVGQALRFPKKLAILLEQGESIIRFVVRPDGKLDGAVVLVKSAGFDEFDEEAISAVKRAAPFAAFGRAVSVSMRIPFESPSIR